VCVYVELQLDTHTHTTLFRHSAPVRYTAVGVSKIAMAASTSQCLSCATRNPRMHMPMAMSASQPLRSTPHGCMATWRL